jgi:hypothetical protein
MLIDKKIAILDIDGVLNNYPIDFISWANEKFDLSCENIFELKGCVDYRNIKQLYRLSGVKRNLNVNKGLNLFLKYLFSENYYLWIITSRPVLENTISDTKYWLHKNEIYYDRIDFCRDKATIIKQNIMDNNKIFFMIEDNASLIDNVLDVKVENKFPIIFFDIHNLQINKFEGNNRVVFLQKFSQVVSFLQGRK